MLPIQPLTKEQFWQMKRDRVADVEIAMRSGLMNEQIDAFLANVHQIVNRPASLHQDHLQAGVPQAFATLKTYGVQIILVTLRQQQQVERIMQSYGLRSSISAIFGAQDRQSAYDNHADHKTALLNDAIAEAHRRRWTPGWMIGDTEADILAGQSLHIPTISLTCGIRSRLYLEQFQPDLFQHNLLSAVGHLLRHRDRALVTQPCFA
jgi:phosphoglycolate phosphatase-like HAD superfamily hydrolase